MTFTAAAFKQLQAGEVARCSLVPGLMLLKGKRRHSYYLRYRDEFGKERRPAIGTWPVLEPKMAQQKALSMLRKLQLGELAGASMTLEAVHDAWLRDEAPKLKPTSMSTYRSIWGKYILPALGKKQISKINFTDWQSLHASMPPVMANRMLGFSANLYNQAKRMGVYKGDSPASLVKGNTEKARTRRLTHKELQRFGHRVQCQVELGGKAQRFATLLMMFLYTSCRKNELVNLKWQWVNWDDRTLELPDTKTGFRIIPLSDQAVQCLIDMRPKPTGSVFNLRAREIKDLWAHFKTIARLPDLRIHDLRRSVASFGLNTGLNLKEVGGVLGHSSQQTTEGYAYLEIETTRNNANKIGNAIDSVINREYTDQ